MYEKHKVSASFPATARKKVVDNSALMQKKATTAKADPEATKLTMSRVLDQIRLFESL